MWQQVFSVSEFYYVGQILLAILLGGILGFQRERWGKHAGPRTYALVSAGACLFTILSMVAFSGGDSGRVAAGIVTGIGFLGAGIILHREDRVEGLTTAAGMWAVSAIGMAVGARFFTLAILTALIFLIVLMIDSQKFKSNKDEKASV